MDRDMAGKVFTYAFVILALVGALGAVYTNCADGTVYYQCSSKQPGYACIPESTSRNTIQNVLGETNFRGELSDMAKKCACSNFPGYVEVNKECVKTTCLVSGQTYNNFACVQNSPPNQCSWGQVVANSSVCGCPSGQKPATNNRDCENRIGCRWGTLPTPTGKDCKFNSNNDADDGTLISKQGCAWGTVTCQWNEDCDTAKNANGTCVTKKGCQYSNPTCTSGYTCNQVSGACDKSADTAVPTVPTTPLTTNTTAPTTTGGNAFPCCCPLPAAGAAAAVTLVSYQRMRKKEEEE